MDLAMARYGVHLVSSFANDLSSGRSSSYRASAIRLKDLSERRCQIFDLDCDVGTNCPAFGQVASLNRRMSWAFEAAVLKVTDPELNIMCGTDA